MNKQKKKLEILKRKGEFPIELRNLIFDYEDGNIWSLLKPIMTNGNDNDNEAGAFLRVVEDRLFDLLTEGSDVSCDDRSCCGNDGKKKKGTNKKDGSNGCLWVPSEIETAIRFFPSVLWREPYPKSSRTNTNQSNKLQMNDISSNRMNKQKKKLEILQRKGELPIELRNLIFNYEEGNVWSCLKPTTNNKDNDNDNEAGDFLRVVEDRLFDLLTEGRRCDVSCDDSSCCGNDSKKKKKKKDNGCLWVPSEIETAIRFFPSVLSREPYPIVCLLRLVHSNTMHLSSSSRSCEKSGYCTGCIAMVPLLAELGSELSESSDSGCTFESHQKGGLLLPQNRGVVLSQMTTMQHQQKLAFEDSVLEKLCKIGDCQHPSIEKACCSALRELTSKGLLVEKDVLELGLLKEICWNIDFPENIFRFLALNFSSSFHKLMSHKQLWGARNAFKGVLEVGMDLFPMEMGCLFRKDFKEGKTTYETACSMSGKAYTDKIVYKVLETYLSKNKQQTAALVLSATATITTTCDEVANEKTRNAMFVFAATNNSVPLDFVYFLFRRDPSFFSSDNIDWNAAAGVASPEPKHPDSSAGMQAEESEKVPRFGGVTRRKERTKGWMNEEIATP